MATIFVDESGNFARNGDPYFVVASFIVGDVTRTEKRFRSWQKSKFPKKLKAVSEVKFSEPGIDDRLREKTVRFLANLDIRIRYTYLKLKNIPEEYHHKGSLREGHLYTHVIGATLEQYLPPTDGEFRVFCDHRSLKGLTSGQFSRELKDRFAPLVPAKTLIDIRMIDSTSTANMQIIDWVAGTLAANLNKKPNGEKYFAYLRNNIISQKELFPDPWNFS